MEATRSKHLSIAIQALMNLYVELKGEGLLSIYLWGSILRNEYEPGISDVDALGIINDNFSEERQSFSNSFLQEHAPELHDFRINFIRFSELNGAVPKTHLAKVTPAPVMILMFPDWKYICGNKYELSDFTIETPTYEQVIGLSVNVLDDFYLPALQRNDFTKFKSVVKRVMYICHFMHEIAKGSHSFSYVSLHQYANEQTRNILDLLFHIKERDYKLPTENELKCIFEFLDFIRKGNVHRTAPPKYGV